jgi:DNA segregation ATPase FtsK/SpoIIIE-like protein
MMVSARRVEEAIAQLTQMALRRGIHLIRHSGLRSTC